MVVAADLGGEDKLIDRPESDYENVTDAPLPDKVWDLVVIGGGTAGFVGARAAARFGASVLLIEEGRIGGDCLWTGCVPSKALLAAAGTAHEARTAKRFGLEVNDLRVDFAHVMRHVNEMIATIAEADSPLALLEAGISVLHGSAAFTSPETVSVGQREFRFRQVLLATGASPRRPTILGLQQVKVLTSENLWQLDALPTRLLVLGGGSIGTELGQAFARLGAIVTIIEAEHRILPREDPEASRLVTDQLRQDGVTVLAGTSVSEIVVDSDRGLQKAMLSGGAEIPFDRVLVAVGRSPELGRLRLEAARVDVNPAGFVVVNDCLRTTNRRIWAAGDVTAYPQFTHAAGAHAVIAVGNAILGLRRKAHTSTIPRVTFTDPEVASVGIPREHLPELRSLTLKHSKVDRAVVDRSAAGFTRLIVDPKGRIRGATIVGPRAGEVIIEPTLAIRSRMRVSDLATLIHPYPTYSTGLWLASVEEMERRLAAPALTAFVKLLARIRRTWLRIASAARGVIAIAGSRK